MNDVTERAASGSPLPDLGPTARRVAALAAAVNDGQLSDPTPCPHYPVRRMLGHLLGLSAAFGAAGRKDLGEATSTSPADRLPDIDDEGRWRTELPLRLDELAAAWRDPAAWEGMTQVGGVTLPADRAGQVALNELLIHGWDLARGIGLPYEPDDESLRSSYAMLAPSAADRPQGGPFGPAVQVAADAPLLDQVIALSGRDPQWKP